MKRGWEKRDSVKKVEMERMWGGKEKEEHREKVGGG